MLLDSRGLVHLRNRNPAQALADFEASQLEAESSETYFHIALAQGQLDRHEAARRSLARADELGLKKSQLHPSERVMLTKLQASVKH